MGLFSKEQPEEKVVKPKATDADKLKLVHRLALGKVKKELAEANIKVGELEGKLSIKDAEKAKVQESLDFYKGLENDRESIDSQKRVLKVVQEDLAEDKKLLEHRTERLSKREKVLEEDENAEYKKGYSDGLADGLRKAHDITREDRKMLTMIAVSTNQSGAIKESAKLLEDVYKDDDKKSE